ncbi:MAG TPA: WD40 repeat domain-containing protein [Candidatus Acidoferrum sp.]|nr:WD40 repeat domain-containing protein [Candidatus Acidoferrum sp.]
MILKTAWKTRVRQALRLVGLLAIPFLAGCCVTLPRQKLGVRPDAMPDYHQVVFSPDGRSVAAINAPARMVLVFDTTNTMETARFQPATLQCAGPRFSFSSTRRLGPEAVAFTPDQRLIAAFWLPHQQIGIWDVTRAECIIQLPYRAGSIALALSPDGSRAAYEAVAGQVAVQGLSDTNTTVFCPLDGQRPEFLTISPDNRWLAAIDRGGAAWIWDLRTGLLWRKIPRPPTGPITSLAFSGDSTMVARSEKNLQIWRLDPWEQLHFFESPRLTGGTRVVGSTLNFLSSGKDADSSPPAALYNVPPTGRAVFSPDNRCVAVINCAFTLNYMEDKPDMGVRVYSLETGQLLSDFAWPDLINDLAFSPDGTRIATGGTGVEVWDWRNGAAAH